MKKLIVIIFALIILLHSAILFSQEQHQVTHLIDKSTLTPIVGATYRCGNQSGVSDEQGNISFTYHKNDTLYLSHISYGDWFLVNDQIGIALKTGIIYKDKEIMTSQPITVIALRPKFNQSEIFRLDVRDKLAHDAGSVLNQSPLISSIRKSGSYGYDPVLRGFKYDQLNVVINGVQSSAAACPNRMDPPTSQVAPNMIEHIEVLKGPHSFRYGIAIGGTINFESAPIRFAKEHNYYGRLSSSAESNGEIYRTEGVVGLNGNYYDLSLFGSFSKGNDYKAGNNVTIAANFQRSSFSANLGLRISQNQQLIISATRNIAKDTDFPALLMDLRSDETQLINLRHEIKLDSKYLKSWKTTSYGTFVDHHMDNLLKQLQPRMVNASTDAKTKSYGGRTEGTWSFNQGKLYSGVDLRIESAQGKRSREFLMGMMAGKTVYDNVWNGSQVSRTGFFAEYHHYLHSTKLVISGRLEFNDAKATDLDPDFAEKNQKSSSTQINPNLSIGGYWGLGNGFTTGLWLGHAQRSGSLTERYINSFPVGLDAYDMLGNPQLSSEINNQIDFILGFKSTQSELDLNVFMSFLKNYISSVIDTSLTPTMPSSPGVRRYINIKDAFKTGFEFSWKQRLIAGLEHQLNIVYTYGHDKARDEPLPEIAPLDFRYTISGSFINEKLIPVATYRHVITQDRISRAFGETKTPSFSLLDISLTYRVSQHLGATLGVENAFDEQYYEHLNRFVKNQPYPIFAPGRNFYLSVFIDFM
jgi:iron complex outermembrane receptor protein